MSSRLVGFDDKVLNRRVYECLSRWLNFSEVGLPEETARKLNLAGQIVAKAHLDSGVSSGLEAKALEIGVEAASQLNMEAPKDLESLAVFLSDIRRSR